MVLEIVSEFAVSSLLQQLVDTIISTAATHTSDIEIELRKLEATYLNAQAMLGTIDGWELVSSKSRRDWIAEVQGACYDAEDFIEYNLEILNRMRDANFLSSFFTKLRVSCRLRHLQGNLDSSINASHCRHSCESSVRRRNLLVTGNTEPVPLLDDASFWRKKDKDATIAFFKSSSSSSSRIVVISGMFGIGKTTLAQVVKNDLQIQNHFDHRLWVSVSGDFDIVKVLGSMIVDLQEERIGELHSRPFPDKLSGIISMFQGLCKEKRLLVVLDDLYSFVKPQDWEDFISVLDPSCVFGVIITTRNPKVASTAASASGLLTHSCYLQTLSDEDCVSLILSKANSDNVNNPHKRKNCGKTTLEIKALKIAEKFCKGLPLVVDIIRCHFPYEPEVKWENIDLWDMPEFKDHIFPAFRLNYSDLSIFLKNCLPYFSLFPENHNFNKDELIRLWMAEGFIRPQVAGVRYLECPGLEELGSYAFDEVLSRSILQIYCPFNQDPQIYRMHEFIRRYAQYIGSDTYVRIDEQLVPSGIHCGVTLANKETHPRKMRHLSFLCQSIPPKMWKDIERCEGLRTILSLHEFTKINQLSYTLFLKLQWLRVLVLSRTDITELPESLGKLKHLRLLDVSETDLEELPRSTADLCGLQVLRLNHCHLLLQLPKYLKNLTRLQHLEVDIKGLSFMPLHIGKLSSLRTLRAFIVGRKDGNRVTELRNMKNLEGSICLTNLENVKDEAEAREAMLSNKSFLKRVELEWNGYQADHSLPERIFTGFEPHDNLEELQVTEYGGVRFPDWLSSPECKLTSIHFVRCNRCSILPTLGQLQHLKTLCVEEMHRVHYIDHHFSGSAANAGFPSLESLKFQDMLRLEKWEGLQANQMPRLCDLNITECPNLTSLPPLNHLTSLVNLEIYECPKLQALPEGGLPSSLETLIIVSCNLLKERCLPKIGADWEKVKAISTIIIDSVHISSHESLKENKLVSRP